MDRIDFSQTRAFLSMEDIQKQYLPISRKKIRSFVKASVPYQKIGRRIYVSRKDLEAAVGLCHAEEKNSSD